MKCSELNIIDYLEGNLNDENALKIKEHLNTCSSCMAKYQALKKVYLFIEEEKKEEVNPFIANQILEKVKNSKTFSIQPRWQSTFIAAASILLLVGGISFGIWFGSGTANINAQGSYANLEMQSYFYDINQEPLVSTLLEENYENNN